MPRWTRLTEAALAMVAASGLALSLTYYIEWARTGMKTSDLLRPSFLALLGVSTGVALVYVLLIRLSRPADEILQQLVSVRKSLEQAGRTALAGAIDKKKASFLNIPNISFHFANKDEIRSFYNDYFKEPTVEQLVNEVVSQVSGDVEGKLPRLLEARAAGTNLSKWISTIKVADVSVAEMFRRYQRETIRNDQVTLGLDLVDIDLSDLKALDDLVSKLQTDFEMHLAPSELETQRAKLREKAAERTLVRLEKATAWILIEGKFTISEAGQDFYRLTYEHPVNQYLAGGSNRVRVALILRKDSLEPSVAGNYQQSIGESIPLKVYGKVWRPVDRKSGVWELQVTPLAVY